MYLYDDSGTAYKFVTAQTAGKMLIPGKGIIKVATVKDIAAANPLHYPEYIPIPKEGIDYLLKKEAKKKLIRRAKIGAGTLGLGGLGILGHTKLRKKKHGAIAAQEPQYLYDEYGNAYQFGPVGAIKAAGGKVVGLGKAALTKIGAAVTSGKLKFRSLDPKIQTALKVGGYLTAAAGVTGATYFGSKAVMKHRGRKKAGVIAAQEYIIENMIALGESYLCAEDPKHKRIKLIKKRASLPPAPVVVKH